MRERKRIKLSLDKELKNFSDKKNQYTIPIFIPHKGCNNECVFCNQRKISGQNSDVTINDVRLKIEEYLKYFDDINTKKNIEIAFFGGSFTGIPINEQIDYLEIANEYVNKKKIDSIRLSTRPDYINVGILNILKKYNVSTIELGVQSMKDEILNISKRGHTASDVVQATKLIQLYNMRVGHQIMIGLPKSTLEDEIYTIKEVLKLKPLDLRIYPVYVIEKSELYEMYKNGEYIPLTIEESVRRVYSIVKECMTSEIKIIRLGLQSTEEITVKNTKVMGPVCDNFAEFVLAKIVRAKMEEVILKYKDFDIEFIVPSKYISITGGPKKVNKIYFKEKYDIDIVIKGE